METPDLTINFEFTPHSASIKESEKKFKSFVDNTIAAQNFKFIYGIRANTDGDFKWPEQHEDHKIDWFTFTHSLPEAIQGFQHILTRFKTEIVAGPLHERLIPLIQSKVDSVLENNELNSYEDFGNQWVHFYCEEI